MGSFKPTMPTNIYRPDPDEGLSVAAPTQLLQYVGKQERGVPPGTKYPGRPMFSKGTPGAPERLEPDQAPSLYPRTLSTTRRFSTYKPHNQTCPPEKSARTGSEADERSRLDPAP